jgi:DNA-directed RNA polymerase subunit M/transcription elongation factor TFIIS
MKKIRCPKCDNHITFDEKRIEAGHALAFRCPHCGKNFSIKLKNKEKEIEDSPYGYIVVIENVFCEKQVIPLQLGENLLGRRSKGTEINCPIATGDMSMDRKHCVVYVEEKINGTVISVKDYDSVTGTFVMNEILQKNEKRILSEGDIITLGATTLILKLKTN